MITVVRGKVEEVTLPEDCDIIISEPMGTLLVNERSKTASQQASKQASHHRLDFNYNLSVLQLEHWTGHAYCCKRPHMLTGRHSFISSLFKTQ